MKIVYDVSHFFLTKIKPITLIALESTIDTENNMTGKINLSMPQKDHVFQSSALKELYRKNSLKVLFLIHIKNTYISYFHQILNLSLFLNRQNMKRKNAFPKHSK